jgi:hypothetical protein
MTTGQLTIVCIAGLIGLIVLVVGASVVVGADRKAQIAHGSLVTVHTNKPDDQTLHGVLIGDYADRLVLEGAKYVTSAGEQPIPGAVVVPKSSVSWLQQHAPQEA